MRHVIWRETLALLVLTSVAMTLTACPGAAGASQALGQDLDSADASHSDRRGISVTGTGVVTIDPDLAVLSLGVEQTADTVAKARTGAAERMDVILAVLRDAGIRDDDIETRRFQIRPEYQQAGDESRLTGFRVSNMLQVEMRDLDNVGNVIDRVVAAGGDATRINNIAFTLEGDAEAENEARRLAIQDAVAKADLYADELGLSRGRLLSLTETTEPQFPGREAVPMPAMAPDEGGVPTPIEPGELDVMVNVEAVFAIQ